MKSESWLWAFLIGIFCIGVFLNAHDLNKKSQKYEAVWTIKYNAETLHKIAELDDYIRQHFKDACNIDIKLKEVGNSGTIVYSNATDIIYFNAVPTETLELTPSEMHIQTLEDDITIPYRDIITDDRLPELHYELHQADDVDMSLYELRDSTDHGM